MVKQQPEFEAGIRDREGYLLLPGGGQSDLELKFINVQDAPDLVEVFWCLVAQFPGVVYDGFRVARVSRHLDGDRRIPGGLTQAREIGRFGTGGATDNQKPSSWLT
jgi:hypothetical protein